MTTLYRAANDDYIQADSTSFSESLAAAEQYLDNPGFGGSSLWSVDVSESPLDLSDMSESEAMEALAEIGIDDAGPGCTVCELIPRRAYELRDAGVRWVRVREIHPVESTTWIYVGGSDDEPEMTAL